MLGAYSHEGFDDDYLSFGGSSVGVKNDYTSVSTVKFEVPSFMVQTHTPNKRVFTPASCFEMNYNRDVLKGDTGNKSDYLQKTNTVECLQEFLLGHGRGIDKMDLRDVGIDDLFGVVPVQKGDETCARDANLGKFAYSVKQAIEFKHKAVDVVENRQLKRALNGPFITALNAYAPSWTATTRILVVGAHDGDDFSRIRKALSMRGRGLGNPIVDTVEPNACHMEALRARRSEFHGEDWCMRVQDISDIANQYDLVLMHYSFHLVCRNHKEMAEFSEVLHRLLAPKGRVIGTFMDVTGAQLLGEPDANSHSDVVRALNTRMPDEHNEWGSVDICVGGHTWTDPIVPLDLATEQFSLLGFSLDAYPGREVANRLPTGVITGMKPWFNETEMRCVMYFEIVPWREVQPNGRVVRLGEELVFQPAGAVPVGFKREPLNRGMSLSAGDLPFLRHGPHYVSVKIDGVPGMMYGCKGAQVVYTMVGVPGKESFYVCNLSKPLETSFTSQVELATPLGPPPVIGEFRAFPIVTDPIQFGLVPLNAFSARLNQAQAVVGHFESLSFLGMKPWYVFNTEGFNEVWPPEKWRGLGVDGVVFQQALARPGMFDGGRGVGGVGSCRYLKPMYSVDLVVFGGIVQTHGPFEGVRVEGLGAEPADCVYEVALEVTPFVPNAGRPLKLTGALRPRPDKLEGNPLTTQENFRYVAYVREVEAVLSLKRWYTNTFLLSTLCPRLYEMYLGAGSEQVDISGNDELESEGRMLGMSYGARLEFPRRETGEYELGPDQRAGILAFRYECYVRLWAVSAKGVDVNDFGRMMLAKIG